MRLLLIATEAISARGRRLSYYARESLLLCRRRLAATALGAALVLAAAGGAAAQSCATKLYVKKGGGAPYYTTISAAVAAVPASYTGNYCVIVDSQVYAEQVTVNREPADAVSRLTIMADPGMASSTSAVVSPPAGSTVAFDVTADSVTLQRVDVRPTNALNYGVMVEGGVGSGLFVALSSVNVLDAGGRISIYGVYSSFGGYDTIQFSTITVGAGNAYAVRLETPGNTISRSTMASLGSSCAVNFCIGLSLYISSGNAVSQSYVYSPNSFAAYVNLSDSNSVSGTTFSALGASPALYLTGASSNAFTGVLVVSSGPASYWDVGSNGNRLQASTMSVVWGGYIMGTNASSNTISSSYLQSANSSGDGVYLDAGSYGNAIVQSTIATSASGNIALIWYGSSNTLSGSLVQNPIGYASRMYAGSALNTVSRSTMIAGVGYGLNITNTSSENVAQSYFYSASGAALSIVGSTNVYVSGSTMTSSGSSAYGLYLIAGTSNTVTGSLMVDTTGYGVFFDVGANTNTISLSTMIGGSAGATALDAFYATKSSSNTLRLDYFLDAAGDGVFLDAGSNSNQLVQSTAVGGGSYVGVYFLRNSSNAIVQSVAQGGTGVSLQTTLFTVVSQSTMTGTGASGSGLYMAGASSGTVARSFMNGAAGYAALLSAGSSGNAISYSTAVGNQANNCAFYVGGSSANLVSGSYVVNSNAGGDGFYFDSGALNNTISASTIATSASGNLGLLFLGGSSSNAFAGGLVYNPVGYGARVYANSAGDAISGSTVVAGGAGYALAVYGASATVSQSYLYTASGAGISILNSSGTLVSGSTVATAGAGSYAYYVTAGASNAVVGSVLSAPAGYGAYLGPYASATAISQSTIASSAAGVSALYAYRTSGLSVFGDYIQGSTAVYVAGSTATSIGGSVIVATGTAGDAVYLGGGSVGLTLSSSVVLGQASGRGVALDKGLGGSPGTSILSTNVVSGAQYGLWIAAQAAGAQVYATSNTIVGTISSAQSAYGIYLNGLTTGATIQNDAIVWRTTGDAGAYGVYGLYASASSGINFDHNRIDDAGMVTGGSFYGAYLSNATNVAVKFDDVASTGPALTNAVLLRLGEGSTGVVVKDNVFLSSFPAPGASSGTVIVADAASQTGFAADYNDYFSSNGALGFQWGAASGPQGLAAWRSATAQEARSFSGNPLWYNPAAGVEDFHPLSTAGRWSPATQSFVADGADSPTIDVGDPAEAFANEPAPNAGRANLGSYGNTAQASMSQLLGCAAIARVGASQQYATISAGVAALPTALSGQACVFIEDGATYPEQVSVRNFVANGSSITIEADPDTGLTPTVSPPAGSTAAFVIAQASVNVFGVNIAPTNAMTYGVYASSGYLQLKSVSVQDPGGKISAAGVQLDPGAVWATISYTSVTVAGASAAGFYLNSSSGASISYSSAQASASGAYGAYLNVASSNTFTVFLASNPAGVAMYFNWYANNNLVQLSTITGGAGSNAALDLNIVNDDAIDRSYVASVSAGAVFVNASSNTLSRSTFTTSGLNQSAIYVNAASNTVSQSWAYASSGTAVFLNSSSNTLSQSTFTANFSASNAIYVNSAASYNLVSQSYASNPAGGATFLNGPYNTLSGSSFVSASTASAVYFNASSNTITGCVVSNPGGTGLYVNYGYDHIVQSTFTTGASGSSAIYLFDPGNTISQSYAYNSAGDALFINRPYQTVSQSSFTSSAVGGRGVFFNDSYSTLSGCWISNPAGDAVYVAYPYDTIAASTITSGGANYEAVNVHAADTTILNSYLQGPLHGASLWASTATTIGGSVLVATGTTNSALYMGGGSVGLSLSSSVFLAPSQGVGVFLDAYDSGLVVLSTNVFQGAQFGVFVSTMMPGAQVYATSNTFVLAASPSFYTWGLLLNGLTTGATIQNNGFYYRSPASAGSNWATALQAQSAAGLNIDHNRFDNPGMILGGSYSAVDLDGAASVSFKFNDVFSSGTALVNHYLLQAVAGATGARVRDNVFSSSVSVSGSSATIQVDAASQSGFSADYNDYFSSNGALGFQWGASGASTLAGWRILTGGDASSLSANPLWLNPGAGAEDFHPLSPAGRWSPATQGFVTTDQAASPTIDAGDASEPYSLEPAPNGSRANQGSYGNTAQASKSASPTGVQLAGVWLSSAGLQFSAVAGPPAGYDVDASTDPNFGSFVSSGSPSATTLAPQGLYANATYYLRAGALWGATTAYAPTVVSTATLAKPVSGTAVSSIFVTSTTLNWVPLALSPPDASSNSAEGYLLQASTAPDFNAGATLLSSQTPNVALSTLTLSSLYGGTTYYFRVGSLNWDGALDFAGVVSTLMPVQLGVAMTTHTIALGSQNMGTTVVVSTSILLTNAGNVSETYQFRATTTTAGSPWSVAAAPGLDQYSAWTVVNSTQPGAADFLAADALADSFAGCAAAAFTMGNSTCVQVPVGQTRLIWVQVATPKATSTTAPQSIQITAQAVKDP